MEEGSGVGMARALARHAPTVILRPALGATKALSNALLGVGNALDDQSRRKIEDVSTLSTIATIMKLIAVLEIQIDRLVRCLKHHLFLCLPALASFEIDNILSLFFVLLHSAGAPLKARRTVRSVCRIFHSLAFWRDIAGR
jgi:hypothetical protein